MIVHPLDASWENNPSSNTTSPILPRFVYTLDQSGFVKKSTEAEASPQPPLPEIDSDDERLNEITWNADQVRTRIRNFIDSGEMKIGEFQDAINVSSRSYLDFTRQSGRDKGIHSATYDNAHRFFKKRELQGLKPPRKKRATASSSAGAGATAGKPDPARFDVSGVKLPGDEDGTVPVYDTCDSLRKKIAAHLQEPGVTQAQFLRDAAAAAFPGQEKKLSSKTLGDFRQKHGANAGATSAIFYAGYVFFEKLRVRDGKAKSKFREEMEKVWGGEGMSRDFGSNAKFLCLGDERPFVDRFGQVDVR
ncbi:hypothetical protein P170DRAFT_458240 [Aspergillus steynii IBT 23096]|uniref:DUF7726 domain-containing protein n=1 Tax=Aspergillus steynii IBT 23096 TaxID=1392250 RepID=A0A2I2FZL1_9EURO|nr:uncharacterized protein P170DRAFT_458240 [Aspergillus steynii IBT 23096]PLB46072.1 hypothetical protein P170DRAFT_458240 [Aspergillus steynii IBT 23096]